MPSADALRPPLAGEKVGPQSQPPVGGRRPARGPLLRGRSRSRRKRLRAYGRPAQTYHLCNAGRAALGPAGSVGITPSRVGFGGGTPTNSWCPRPRSLRPPWCRGGIRVPSPSGGDVIAPAEPVPGGDRKVSRRGRAACAVVHRCRGHRHPARAQVDQRRAPDRAAAAACPRQPGRDRAGQDSLAGTTMQVPVPDAFEAIRRHARANHLTVRAVAQRVIDEGASAISH